jgi:phage terminase small subunit
VRETAQKLTVKQQLFVEAYLGKANGSGVEAARLAGYRGSDETLRAVAYENLTKPHIAEAVAGRLEEARKCLSADEVLAELTEIGGASWRDFTEIKVGRDGETMEVTVRLTDKLKALELLGKHHKLFTERHEQSGSQTIRVVYENRPIEREAEP